METLIEDDADFRRTVKESKDLCQVWWERQGRKMSCGESDGNATTWIFNMKNRFGWKDKTETEHTGNVAVTQITRRIVRLAMELVIETPEWAIPLPLRPATKAHMVAGVRANRTFR